MKRLLSMLGTLVLLVVFLVGLVGCSGSGVIPPPFEEPPIDLIREYTARDVVQRWADGKVSIVDATGETKEIWDKINKIIDGPVVFKMTNDPTAQIGIEYHQIDGMFYVGFPGMEENTFKGCGILINPETTPDELLETVCQAACLIAVGINNHEKWEEGFSPQMKSVIYWLYRLEPGYPLL